MEIQEIDLEQEDPLHQKTQIKQQQDEPHSSSDHNNLSQQSILKNPILQEKLIRFIAGHNYMYNKAFKLVANQFFVDNQQIIMQTIQFQREQIASVHEKITIGIIKCLKTHCFSTSQYGSQQQIDDSSIRQAVQIITLKTLRDELPLHTKYYKSVLDNFKVPEKCPVLSFLGPNSLQQPLQEDDKTEMQIYERQRLNIVDTDLGEQSAVAPTRKICQQDLPKLMHLCREAIVNGLCNHVNFAILTAEILNKNSLDIEKIWLNQAKALKKDRIDYLREENSSHTANKIKPYKYSYFFCTLCFKFDCLLHFQEEDQDLEYQPYINLYRCDQRITGKNIFERESNINWCLLYRCPMRKQLTCFYHQQATYFNQISKGGQQLNQPEQAQSNQLQKPQSFLKGQGPTRPGQDYGQANLDQANGKAKGLKKYVKEMIAYCYEYRMGNPCFISYVLEYCSRNGQGGNGIGGGQQPVTCQEIGQYLYEKGLYAINVEDVAQQQQMTQDLQTLCNQQNQALQQLYSSQITNNDLDQLDDLAKRRRKKKKYTASTTQHNQCHSGVSNNGNGGLIVLPYNPCFHDGDCDQSSCECIRTRKFCEKYCGCSIRCQRRFRGCRCEGTCSNNSCPCRKSNRDCDPDICLCYSNRNSRTVRMLCEYNPQPQSTQQSRQTQQQQGQVQVQVQVQDTCIFKNKCACTLKVNLPFCSNTNVLYKWKPRLLLQRSLLCEGMGVVAGQDLRVGDFIGEYCGEVISQEESTRRMIVYTNIQQFFFFNLERDTVVDAFPYGNKLRFINHGYEDLANAEVQMRFVEGRYRIVLAAYNNITIGEEILFDYGADFKVDWKEYFNKDAEVWIKNYDRSRQALRQPHYLEFPSETIFKQVVDQSSMFAALQSVNTPEELLRENIASIRLSNIKKKNNKTNQPIQVIDLEDPANNFLVNLVYDQDYNNKNINQGNNNNNKNNNNTNNNKSKQQPDKSNEFHIFEQ